MEVTPIGLHRENIRQFAKCHLVPEQATRANT
jgi:hypothetical protein